LANVVTLTNSSTDVVDVEAWSEIIVRLSRLRRDSEGIVKALAMSGRSPVEESRGWQKVADQAAEEADAPIGQDHRGIATEPISPDAARDRAVVLEHIRLSRTQRGYFPKSDKARSRGSNWERLRNPLLAPPTTPAIIPIPAVPTYQELKEFRA